MWGGNGRPLVDYFETFGRLNSLFQAAAPADLQKKRQREFEFEHSIATLLAYTLKAYSAEMILVELTSFVAFRDACWTDDDLRALQSFLLVSPDAGDLTPRQIAALTELMKDMKDG